MPSKEDVLKRMMELADPNLLHDTEIAHTEADKLLCQLLETLGHHDIVEAWKKVEKWYA